MYWNVCYRREHKLNCSIATLWASLKQFPEPTIWFIVWLNNKRSLFNLQVIDFPLEFIFIIIFCLSIFPIFRNTHTHTRKQSEYSLTALEGAKFCRVYYKQFQRHCHANLSIKLKDKQTRTHTHIQRDRYIRNVFAWKAYAHFLIGNVCNQSEPEILLIIATFKFLSFFFSFYSITLYHFHLLPYFCWLLVARATCARKHINLIATICCPAPPCQYPSLHLLLVGRLPLWAIWYFWQQAAWFLM